MAEPIRLARPNAPLRFIALHIGALALVNWGVFASGALRPLAEATGGLITGSLVTNLAFLLVLVAWVIVGQGALRLADIGVIAGRLPLALAGTAALWAAAQVFHAVAGLLTYGRIEIAPIWNSAGATILIGALLAQVFGNALFEEIAYRGFLFPQFFLRLSRLDAHPWLRVLAAAALSQGVFALTHIPNRIYLGLGLEAIAIDLLVLLAIGLLFTALYIRTDNLFLVVGVHALANAPTTLFRTAPALAGFNGGPVIYALVIAGFAVLPWAARRWRQRRQQVVDAQFDESFYDRDDDLIETEAAPVPRPFTERVM